MAREAPQVGPLPGPEPLAERRPGWRSRLGAVAAGVIGAVC